MTNFLKLVSVVHQSLDEKYFFEKTHSAYLRDELKFQLAKCQHMHIMINMLTIILRDTFFAHKTKPILLNYNNNGGNIKYGK